MLTMVVWTFVALVAAALVLVVASVAEGRSGGPSDGVRGFLRSVWAGLRGLRAGSATRSDARAAVEEPADSSLDDFFAATEVQDPAYVAVEDLTETLARARERAARGVSGLARR